MAFQVLVMVGLGFFAQRRLTEFQFDQVLRKLEQVTPIAAVAFSAGERTDPAELDRRAKRMGRSTVRVTYIAPDGTVLADSDEAPGALENHRERPEVVAAIASGTGHSVRHSATLSEDMIYWAEPVRGAEGKIEGVVRTALPLGVIHAALVHAEIAGGLGLALSLLLNCLVILVGSRRLSRSVESMV